MSEKKDIKHHMQDLSKLGASKGGKKRMENMSPEERSEHARYAALERWNTTENQELTLPKEAYTGEIMIGDHIINCAVLENGTRILSERKVAEALDSKRGGSHWVRKKNMSEYRPVFISANNIAQYMSPSLAVALSRPIKYRTKSGKISPVYGVEASLLPEICDVWLKARRAGALRPDQVNIANNAEILLLGLANVGIIALVDEATGYQDVRARDELNHILAAYISPTLLPWAKKFPDEFYKEIFRLRGWSYHATKRPRIIGKLTNQIVYERLPAHVLKELETLNPVVNNRRRYRHHQFLTEDIGHPHLEKHILIATTLLRIANTWDGFKKMLDKAFPAPGSQIELFDEDEA